MNATHSHAWSSELADRIERDGFVVLRRVLANDRAAEVVRDLESVLKASADVEAAIRSSRGSVYASRNLLQVWPRAVELAREPALAGAIRDLLGPDFGLVRALYFDKPPERSWSLPWHKDMTIAVRDNRLPSRHFTKPTTKAGVPHVEAPEGVLADMLTARIHLDDVTDENGPLVVIPGSHRDGKTLAPVRPGAAAEPILVSAGDVLLMRPLVTHSSGNSRAGTRRHRRIVHLEFASARPLPDGYGWHDFHPIESVALSP